jgi:hypothetical protein
MEREEEEAAWCSAIAFGECHSHIAKFHPLRECDSLDL